MEDSRKICLAALFKSKDEIKHQPSREIVRMLITQLENKHLEEQIFKLKLEAEKKEKEHAFITTWTSSQAQHTSSLTGSSSIKEQPLANMKNDQPIFPSIKPASLKKPAFSSRSLSDNSEMFDKPKEKINPSLVKEQPLTNKIKKTKLK